MQFIANMMSRPHEENESESTSHLRLTPTTWNARSTEAHLYVRMECASMHSRCRIVCNAMRCKATNELWCMSQSHSLFER